MLLSFEDGPLLTAVPCGRETRIHTGNLQSRKSILDAFQSLSGFEGRTEWFWMVIIGFVNVCSARCGLRELANTSASRTPWGNASYGTFWLEFLNSKKWISFPVTGWTLQCSLFSPKASKFPGSICSPTVAHRSCSPCLYEVFIFPGGTLDRKASGGVEWGTWWMVSFITTAPVTTCWRYRWWPHVIYTVTQQLKMLTQPHAVSEGGIISLPCWHLWRGQHCICIVQHHSDPNPQQVHQSYFQKAI